MTELAESVLANRQRLCAREYFATVTAIALTVGTGLSVCAAKSGQGRVVMKVS